MNQQPANEWVSPTGLRTIGDSDSTAVPIAVMNHPSLSLGAKGLYALILSYQGAPVDPYDGAIEDQDDIRAMLEELVTAGLVVRVSAPE